MIRPCRWVVLLYIASCFSSPIAFGQIDPVKRELVQIGYNAALQGHAPQSGYAFYYLNNPGFLRTNLALRLAIAPTYLDSELGIREVFGPYTDVGIGLAGGGFADNYNEIRGGKFLPEESFNGYGGEVSLSLYHLFNPGAKIPLNGVLRGTVRYSTYDDTKDTDSNFIVPDAYQNYSIRTGFRWGGREPTLFPSLAMELSIWYQGHFRSDSQTYGFNGDHEIESSSHIFWGQALLAYVLPESKHSFYLSLSAGTSVDADRFSTYRLGALLPLVSEFPLSLPGYYYQELSAKNFILFGGNYMMPLDKKGAWSLDINVATAGIEYLPGQDQQQPGWDRPGNWHTGVGGGILYKSASWKVMVGYAYGVNAVRSDGPGAHSIGLLMQLDWEQAREALFSPAEPNLWRGLQQIIGLFGS